MRIRNKYVIFVYSEIQENQELSIAKKYGKKFICGTVSSGSDRKKYTNIVYTEDDLSMMYRHYPDTKVIKSGYIKDITYTEKKLIKPTLNNN